MKKILLLSFLSLGFSNVFSQSTSYWQQHVDYKMDVTMNVETYQYKGKQELVYTNNSNDTLHKVFYHLYNNAFQPGSEMDMRLQNIKDPDGRMVDRVKTSGNEFKNESRIAKLQPNEIGYLHISNFKQDGVATIAKEVETILEVTLSKPILPGKSTTFTLDFDGQVPVQIRRSGRNNSEGIELSMAQWYANLFRHCSFLNPSKQRFSARAEQKDVILEGNCHVTSMIAFVAVVVCLGSPRELVPATLSTKGPLLTHLLVQPFHFLPQTMLISF